MAFTGWPTSTRKSTKTANRHGPDGLTAYRVAKNNLFNLKPIAMKKTLQDILEDWYIEPLPLAEMILEEFLEDLEQAGAFDGGAFSAKEVMDNLKKI